MTDATIAPWTVECEPRRAMYEVMASRRTFRALPKGIWLDLAVELSKRLECTPMNEALKVKFASVALARRAFAGLRQYLRPAQVEMHRQDHVIFFARTVEFKKGEYKNLS